MHRLYAEFDSLSECALWIDALWEFMGEEWDENGDSDDYDELKAWRDELLAVMEDVMHVE